MSNASATATVEMLQAFADAWNRRDTDALMSFMSDDCVFEASSGPDVSGTRYVGREAVKAGYGEVFATFPDAHWGGARHFVQGARGVSEWTFTGTRTDGTRVEVNGCDLFTFQNGKIAVKNSFRKNRPPLAASLTLFYFVRGVSTAIIMTTLAAWLMLGYRRRYEEILRRQSEEAQRMRLFFENIIRGAGQAIICLDTQGIIRTWNRAAEEIYGWTADEIIGQPLDRLVPVDLRQSGEPRELMQAVLEKGCVRDFETRRLRKDGGVVRVRITRSALRDTEGNLIGSSAIVSDITSAKEMESRLIHSEKLIMSLQKFLVLPVHLLDPRQRGTTGRCQ